MATAYFGAGPSLTVHTSPTASNWPFQVLLSPTFSPIWTSFALLRLIYNRYSIDKISIMTFSSSFPLQFLPGKVKKKATLLPENTNVHKLE